MWGIWKEWKDHLTNIRFIMKKIFTIVVLAMISAMSWAASMTISPSFVDFGTVSIKGETLPKIGSQTITVSFSGFDKNDQGITASITEGIIDSETNPSGFYVSGDSYVFKGYDVPSGTCEFTIAYYVVGAGTFTGEVQLTSDYGVTATASIKVVVTDDAIVAKTTPFERINSTSELKDGDTIVFISEASGSVGGPLTETYLPAVTENVSINASAGTAEIPEEAQFFRAKKFSGNWQFINIDTDQRLHLDVSGKGAFTYAATQAGTILANWGVSITNGAAVVSRPDEEQSFAVEFNASRFKPYKNPQGSTIQLYKKAGAAQEVQSKLEVEDVVFGDVENDEQKSVTVNYTAENLEDDIIWEIEGTDADLFSVADQGSREAGMVTITYLGTSDKTGALDARLSYLTVDAKLDMMEGSKAISINLIPATVKLTNLAFENAPETIDQGQTIDMSQFVVYTPNEAADKSLTWSVNKTYQGEIDQDGKLTAKHVTGTIEVTATSVRVPSVSASVTLTITEPIITDFTLSKTEITLNIGGIETLEITAFVPTYASASATWASSDATIAKVNKNGVVTAVALGDAEITATIGEVVKSCTVHVIAVTVNSIELPEEANLTIGSSLQLTPVVEPAQAAEEYTITYESNAPEIATVSETGLVHGIAEGDAVITATIAELSAQITIHVARAQTFSKVTDASTLAEKDTIILARQSVPVIAGARDNKKLTVLLQDITVTETEAYADDACRMVLGTENNKEGFTLTIVGGKMIAVASNGNDIVDANTQNCKFWEFVADGDNGYFVRNIGNKNAMFKYLASNAAIKPYKENSAGAVYVYAYVRKYVAPTPGTGVENTAVELKAQKILRDGQVLILRNGILYDMNGRQVEK